MKNYLKNNGIWVLFAAAVLSVAMAVLSTFSNTSSPLSNLARIVGSPFRTVYAAAASWLDDKQAYYQDSTALKEENAALRLQIAQMEEAVRQAEADRDENRRLRELLNLRAQHRDFELEAAYITEHAVTNWTSSLTLNKGTAHGVEVNDCVVDESYALVGIISQVGTNWSTVLTLVDTDTSLGARVFRTKDLAVAQGEFSLMGQHRLRLDYLPTDCQLLGGDLVVTSGLGGFYPSDLVIGTVEEIQMDDSGAASYAVLSPRVHLDELTEVFIIKDFDIVT